MSVTAVWGGSILPTVGVESGTMLQLETSPLSMKEIRTNFRGDKISMGEMVLGNIGHSSIWIVDNEESLPVGLPYATAFCPIHQRRI